MTSTVGMVWRRLRRSSALTAERNVRCRRGWFKPSRGWRSKNLEFPFQPSTGGLQESAGKSRRKPSLTLEAFDAWFKAFLLHTYRCRPNKEDELSPIQKWEKGGFLPRMLDSLERLDLLLVHEAKERKVRPDGIHFHRLRYLSSVLAAYVGESITVRYDPRDMGEVRVFYRDKFLCRAISAELTGAVFPLREIVWSRNQRRNELRGILKNRQEAVDALLDLKRGHVVKEPNANSTVLVEPPAPKLKRYRNE